MTPEQMSLQDQSVLICDQDAAILDLLTDVFEEQGALVTQALSGKTVIDTLRWKSFDLILQALVLPDLNGWDVLRFVRTYRPDLSNRVIMMTGYTYDPETVQRIKRENHPALFKPFDFDQLREIAYTTLRAFEPDPKRIAA